VGLLGHPFHSPDVAPSDYQLFWKLKGHVAGKKSDGDDKAKDVALRWLHEQAAEFYDTRIKKLVPRHKKCIEKHGHYIEK
jgi:hypothetical protein